MKVEGGFRYFVDNKEVVYKDLQTMIRLDMTVRIDGLNVHYSSPKKEIKTETFGDYVITTVPVKTSNKDRQKLQEIQNIFKEKENKKMNRLIEEELERQWTISSSPTEGTVSAPECSTNLSNKYYPHDGSKEGIKAAGQKILEELERQEQQVFKDWDSDTTEILKDAQSLPFFTKEDWAQEAAKKINDAVNVGKKENSGKIDYSEVDLDILDLMANRFNANKHKYPQGNMLKPIEEKELLFALFRHLKKMIQPIDSDPETFEEHLAAILCNAQMVYQQRKLKNN